MSKENNKENLRTLIGTKGQKYLKSKKAEKTEYSMKPWDLRSGRSANKSLILFISYDVVNSTAYKDMDAEWPNLLLGMFHEIETSFDEFEANAIYPIELWRIVGDEIIFTVKVHSPDTITRFLEIANEILLTTNEKNRHATTAKDNFTLKATAWISIVNMGEEQENYRIDENESIHLHYQNKTRDWFQEYFGNDIDAGFRLEEYSRSDRLVLSFELAYMLEKYGEGKYLHIISYENLKGIWRDRLYPIIWYYRPNDEEQDLMASFDRSFTYDAAVNDSLVQNYLNVRQNRMYQNAMYPLLAEMYDVKPETMEKIAEDIGVIDKIKKMMDMCKNPSGSVKSPDSAFMKVDCVAVCYRMEQGVPRILALKTIPQTRLDTSKWCFGSVAARAGASVTTVLIGGYCSDIGISIRPLLYDLRDGIYLGKDENGTDSDDPIPIALFERSSERSDGGQRKGIVCVAKIDSDDKEQVSKALDDHMGGKYEKHVFLGENDLNWEKDVIARFGDDDVVDNFNRTAKLAFDLIKRFENINTHA